MLSRLVLRLLPDKVDHFVHVDSLQSDFCLLMVEHPDLIVDDGECGKELVVIDIIKTNEVLDVNLELERLSYFDHAAFA